MEVRGQLCALATYSSGKDPWYPLNRNLSGPHSQSGCLREEINLIPTRNRTLDPPVCSIVTILSMVFWLPLSALYKYHTAHLTFMGLCIVNVFLIITNEMQCYTIFFITVNAVHVSGGFSAHHQELKNCTHGIGYMSSLLAVTASSSSKEA